MQDALWISEQTCQFPMLSAVSAYRYGCRCDRCKRGKITQSPLPPGCQHEGCTALRTKGRRWCEEHQPTKTPRIRREDTCQVCGLQHGWYESALTNVRLELQGYYRSVCSACRHRYVSAIKSHNRTSHAPHHRRPLRTLWREVLN